VIGDLVWHDLNGDGLQTVSEPPLAGITVTLYSTGTDSVTGATVAGAVTGTAVLTTVSQLDGRYALTGVLPGRYLMTFVAPAPFIPTRCNAGNDETLDSDGCRLAATTVGQTAPFTVTAQQVQSDWDAGFARPASISGRAYLDLNQNNQADLGEVPIADVVIILQDSDTNLRVLRTAFGWRGKSRALASAGREVARTVTGPDGRYSFVNLTPGRYQLVILTPSGFTVTPPTQSLSWLISGELVSKDIALTALPRTNLPEGTEPRHQLYLPLVQTE
jgi:hypothetical protein